MPKVVGEVPVSGAASAPPHRMHMITPGIAASLTPKSLQRTERTERTRRRLALPHTRFHLPHLRMPHLRLPHRSA